MKNCHKVSEKKLKEIGKLPSPLTLSDLIQILTLIATVCIAIHLQGIEEESHRLDLEATENSWFAYVTPSYYSKSCKKDGECVALLNEDDYISVTNMSHLKAENVKISVASTYLPVYMQCQLSEGMEYNDRFVARIFDRWVQYIIESSKNKELDINLESIVEDAKLHGYSRKEGSDKGRLKHENGFPMRITVEWNSPRGKDMEYTAVSKPKNNLIFGEDYIDKLDNPIIKNEEVTTSPDGNNESKCISKINKDFKKDPRSVGASTTITLSPATTTLSPAHPR